MASPTSKVVFNESSDLVNTKVLRSKDGRQSKGVGKFVFYSDLRQRVSANPAYKFKYLLQTANSPIIRLHSNPIAISWTQQKRISRRDRINGAEFFNFSDSVNASNNDVLTMNFMGTSGNIGPGSDPAAIKALHNLYALSREPILLPDGTANYVHISYKTNVIGDMTLDGFFETPLQFAENAESPFKIDYTFSFVVTEATPSLSDVIKY